MAKKTTEEQEDDIEEFDEFSEEEASDFKPDPAQDKKLNLERRRKIEERIELFRIRDECGDYDLEI